MVRVRVRVDFMRYLSLQCCEPMSGDIDKKVDTHEACYWITTRVLLRTQKSSDPMASLSTISV
jgi:hypothetical protein